jgi:hypothetical protein
MSTFDRAVSSGLSPSVPPSAPRVEIAPTAQRTLRDVVTTAVIAVLAIVIVIAVGASAGRLSWAVVGAMLMVTAAGAAAVGIMLRRWGRIQMAELQHGYTTTTFKLGAFWFAAAPDAPMTLGLIQWDWRGTWVLRPDGEVVSTPSDAFDPPGLYPSPNCSDALELWTGHQWSGYFPKDAQWP